MRKENALYWEIFGLFSDALTTVVLMKHRKAFLPLINTPRDGLIINDRASSREI
jgi:hypothetical protein